MSIEQAARSSETKSRLIADSIPALVSHVDRELRYTFVNQAYAVWFQRPAGDLIGRSLLELLGPASLAQRQPYIDRVLLGEQVTFEGLTLLPSGKPVQTLITYTPEIIDGEVRGFYIFGVDMTQQKQAEVVLRNSEGRFRLLNDLSERARRLADPEQVMAAVARTLGEYLRVSRCAYADVESDSDHFTIRHDYTDGCASTAGDYHLSLFGPRAASDQRSGRTLLVHDVDTELAPAEGADMFNAIGIKAIICCPLVKNGQLVAMMAVHQTTPRRWLPEEVELVEAVVERSWVYIERARGARALAQSEAAFRQLADVMPQIVWGARPDGVLDYYNRRWFEYIALPPERVVDATWDKFVHPDDLPNAYDKWTAVLASGEPYNLEFRVRGGDGQYRWFLVRALTIRDDEGAIIRWIGTCTDIEDRKAAEAERQSLLESERTARSEAERVSRMKDEFLATLSHELRTPLNAILGWSQIVQRGGGVPQDVLQGLEVIERNARAQSQIIEDLLDMSRIISGKVRLDVQRIDLAAIVQSAVDTARPTAEAKAVRLLAIIDPLHDVVVSGDANRLQQVLWNLISNAIKFTPREGRVQVLLERVNSHLEISVIDTGEGIKPEFLPYVFDRFRQADASTTRRHGGLGLGLSIVKQLVELHGGSVRVKSAGTGFGTTFIVSLPVTIMHPETQRGADRRHPRFAPSLQGMPDYCVEIAGVKVLVVDDESDARALVKRLLEDCQAIVTTAASASEALELLNRERFDVLLSDIGMPGQDGYGLIKQVRALGKENGGNIPAIALTAYARAEDRVKAISAGFLMHVAKPVEPIELVTMIAGATGRTGQ